MRVIPTDKAQADFFATCNISESDFDEMLEQIVSGANRIETWMLANGYREEDINYIYQIIDEWLVNKPIQDLNESLRYNQ
jgi:hypothetical protein